MVLPLDTIYAHPSNMLAVMAGELGGPVFRIIVTVDAVAILCGGVLTAIVGVSGLLNRLARDKVLPSFLQLTNRRSAPYASIVMFVAVAIALFQTIFNPANPTDIGKFGGVFAIAFLSVLCTFAVSAALLKLFRAQLPRMAVAKGWQVAFSFGSVFVGLVGNIVLTPGVFVYFIIYLSGFVVVIASMLSQVEIFSLAIWVVSVVSRLFLSSLNSERQSFSAEEDRPERGKERACRLC